MTHQSMKTPQGAMARPLRIYLWLAFGITLERRGTGLLAGDIRPGGASPLHPLHYPAAFGPALSQHQLSRPIFLVNSLALSVIMTWLYQRTRGDLLLMILVHVADYCGGIDVPFNAEVSFNAALPKRTQQSRAGPNSPSPRQI